MTRWDSALEARLRRTYTAPAASGPNPAPAAVSLDDGGVLTEVAGKLILTAPAHTVQAADQLPEAMRERWERASTANPYFMWVHGRYVEAERANRNGAFWSTADLEFGEMSVRHGPLNWLHEGRRVIGAIADNQLVRPEPATVDEQPVAAAAAGWPRPYIAAVSAVWKWLYPSEAAVVQAASETGRLYYSMECVAKEVACTGDNGCGQSYPYLDAIKAADGVCEHIRGRTSVRRMVEPSFLGGAVIVPPVNPGWGEAHAQVMQTAAALAEQAAPPDARASEWEALMAAVLAMAA